jgi:hypothetical protein
VVWLTPGSAGVTLHYDIDGDRRAEGMILLAGRMGLDAGDILF